MFCILHGVGTLYNITFILIIILFLWTCYLIIYIYKYFRVFCSVRQYLLFFVNIVFDTQENSV